MEQTLTAEQLQQLKAELFAPWVNRLDLRVAQLMSGGARFVWQATEELLRGVPDGRKILSGQPVMAVADTASVLTIWALAGRLRACTTVDLHSNFMRPLFDGQIDVRVTAIANGRKTATMRSEFSMADDGKICATATGVFMYLD